MEQHPIEKLQEEISHYMSRNDELQSLYQDEHCEVLKLQEENGKLKSQITSQDCKIYDLKSQLQDKELELIMTKADLCKGCQYKNDYKIKEQTLDKIRAYCIEISEDNEAMVGEYLVSDDILDIINKAKGVNNDK